MLVDTHAYLPPAATLAGITPEDATRRVNGLPHSIGELVAHIAYWQDWFIVRCEGHAEPMASSAALGWPAVAPEDWPAVHERFVTGLERLADIASQQAPDTLVRPAIESPLLAQYSLRDVCEHIAQHNAHHLGQVIVLRQLLGLWPPPSGSYTW
jgi:uncharacterized damage-inducible protein DinB